MYRYSKSMVALPDFLIFGLLAPPEIRLKSDISDSPDFYSSEIRGDRFTVFCVHTARFSGNQLQKVGRLEKIGLWDHGITVQDNHPETCKFAKNCTRCSPVIISLGIFGPYMY